MYETNEEAKQKLQDSVVIFEGNPVYITNASGRKGSVNLHFTPLPLDPHRDIYANSVGRGISDTGWDFRSVGTKLGYTPVLHPVSQRADSVFISRIPARHSRQGLDGKTAQLEMYDKDNYNYQWNDILYRHPGLIKTIRNEYMRPLEAFKLLSNHSSEYKSIPIHRKLALFYDNVSPPYLLYRLDKIGYTEDGLTYKLAKHKEYLREELADMVGLKIA